MPRATQRPVGSGSDQPTVGRPAVISLDDVVVTATRIAERIGIDELTMTLVSDELGVTAAALYHYVPSKQALLTLVIDRAFADFEVPPQSAGPWDLRLRLFERAVRAELRRLKWGTPQAIVSGEPPASFRRLFSLCREIFDETGADDHVVMLAFTTVYAYMVGQLWFDSITDDTAPARDSQIGAAARAAAFDSEELFDFGLGAVIDGLRLRLGLPGTVQQTGSAPSGAV